MTSLHPSAAAPCPRCARPLGRPFLGSPLCARCASERLLAFALTDEADAPTPPAAAPAHTFAGPERIGPYTIISELGRGGMGIVYLAQHTQLGRIVALKVIPCGSAASSALEMRFLREARTVAHLRHPHIVAVHDAGQADAQAYFAMDYVEGGDLAQRLRERRSFEPRTAALLLQRVAAAIAYSHGEGVLHRDLKPSNILLDGEEPRVADFGLAAQTETAGDLTAPLAVLGTAHYAAPETLRGADDRGAPADLYALGVILYELLAGRTPFAGATAAELPGLVARAEPPPLRLLAPHVPRDLETICRCCLEPEPSRRYPGAAALAEDLRRFLAGEPILARPVSPAGQVWRWARRQPQLAAVWVLSFLLAIGSTAAAIGINRERLHASAEAARAEAALGTARRSERLARTRLRSAKFAEARARRGTDEPGRRTAALAALAEADAVQPGADLRDEALAALLIPEFVAAGHWALNSPGPVTATLDPTGRIAALEDLAPLGAPRPALALRRWGEATAFARLAVPETTLAGPVRFSPDGTQLALRFHDQSIHVWRTADAAPQLTLAGQRMPAPNRESKFLNDDVDFTADGAALCVGLDGGGLAWHRIAGGAEFARTAGPLRFTTVRCSPDGRRVAACSVLQTVGHRELWVFPSPGAAAEQVFQLTGLPLSIAWSPDGRLLAVTQNDNTVTAFAVADGRVAHAFLAPIQEPRGVAFLGGSEFVALVDSGTFAHVFNLALAREEGAFGSIGPSALSPNPTGDSFHVTSLDGEVTRWTVRAPTGFRTLTLPNVAGYEVSGDAGGLDFSDDGRWVATAHGRFAAVREVASGAFVGELDGGAAGVVQFSSVMFDRDHPALLRCSTARGLQRHACTLAPDGRLTFAAGEPLDAEPGFLLTARTADRRRIVLLNRNSGDVKVLDLTAGGARLVSRWRTPGVYHGSLSPDGTQLLLNCNGLGPGASAMRLSVHRVADGRVLAEPDAPVSCDTAWSADGHTALTSDGQAESILWNADTWTRRATLAGGLGGNTTTFALSPDGSVAVVCHETQVHLVDPRDGAVRATLTVPGAPGLASAVRFLPDGRRFAVLWPDGRINFFDPAALTAALAKYRIR